jgi:hypothetical protein
MADKYGLEHFSYKSSLQAETSESAQAINLKGQAAARVAGWWNGLLGQIRVLFHRLTLQCLPVWI